MQPDLDERGWRELGGTPFVKTLGERMQVGGCLCRSSCGPWQGAGIGAGAAGLALAGLVGGQHLLRLLRRQALQGEVRRLVQVPCQQRLLR